MTTLTDFLLARIAEDEDAALAPHASVRADRLADMDRIEYDQDRGYARLGIGRLLAECEAKRRIVEACRPMTAVAYSEAERQRAIAAGEGSIRVYAQSGPVWPHSAAEGILRSLALPYADHQDFDPAWAPV